MEVIVWLLKLGHKKHGGFLLALEPLALEEDRYQAVRSLKQPYGEIYVVRNWELLPTACEWIILEADPLGPVKPSDDHSPSQQLDFSLMSDPEPELPKFLPGLKKW